MQIEDSNLESIDHRCKSKRAFLLVLDKKLRVFRKFSGQNLALIEIQGHQNLVTLSITIVVLKHKRLAFP